MLELKNYTKIYANKYLSSGEVARYYVRVIVPSSVTIDSVYSVKVTVYNEEEVVYESTYALVIVPVLQQPGEIVPGDIADLLAFHIDAEFRPADGRNAEQDAVDHLARPVFKLPEARLLFKIIKDCRKEGR